MKFRIESLRSLQFLVCGYLIIYLYRMFIVCCYDGGLNVAGILCKLSHCNTIKFLYAINTAICSLSLL